MTEQEYPMGYNDQHKDYLSALRESGVVNMFGAAPYLQRKFDLTKKEAAQFLLYWINNFEGE